MSSIHARRKATPQPVPMGLQLAELEARRLRREHLGDRLAQVAIAIDLWVRRCAYRLGAHLGAR
jgi:hypothetical protein